MMDLASGRQYFLKAAPYTATGATTLSPNMLILRYPSMTKLVFTVVLASLPATTPAIALILAVDTFSLA